MSRRKARECALQILFQLDFTNSGLTGETLSEFWAGTKEDDETMEFAHAIIKGTREHMARLDEIITRAADNWSVDRMSVVDRNILRASAYELVYRKDIPPAVAINEAVEISKKYSTEDSAPFINGILDRIYKLKLKE
ncbi:MAG: transcription antitermination factor NusB [Nitrospirae bacterium]|nr:transcription antitermination factor NusB [Nitrospirota bacterium]